MADKKKLPLDKLTEEYVNEMTRRIEYDAENSTSVGEEIKSLVEKLAVYRSRDEMEAALADWKREAEEDDDDED